MGRYTATRSRDASKERSGGELLVEEGSLYPALHRLVRLKQLSAEWGTSENNRRARFYRVTPAGQNRLRADASAWRRVSAAVTTMLDGGAPALEMRGLTWIA